MAMTTRSTAAESVATQRVATEPGATRKITKLLVANRGEIARRVTRTAQEMGITSVAVFSEPDRRSTHVLEAAVAVALGGVASTESYLDAVKILDAAQRTGCDAIHPGYGFLSENAGFAQAVIDAGLIWVGPTPDSIRAMADKVQAKRLAQAAGVPLVPGAELDGDPDEGQLLKLAESVGYPLLVKASAGGGGKGMRIVESANDLVQHLQTARREAASSFGDSTVFFERYLAGARHVEVQVFGDTVGNVVHLFERECSIQRRHQKIIEESPSPGATDATLRQMFDASLSLARAIGYVGAGTVEFLVAGDGEEQEFFFLEMNTRLQVEHPITEEVTGLDLVQWQLRIAQGEALPLDQGNIRQHGHAIEARLYAEDPARDYLPSVGELNLPTRLGYGLRLEAAFSNAGSVTPHYDPMIAKVISSGADRTGAASQLAAGLKEMAVTDLVTNRESLIAILESDAFLAGDTTTAFLDENPGMLTPRIPADVRTRHLVAATVARAIAETSTKPWSAGLPAGWRNVAVLPQTWRWAYYEAGETHERVVALRRDSAGTLGAFAVLDAGATGAIAHAAFVPVRVVGAVAGERSYLIEIDGIAMQASVRLTPSVTSVSGSDWTLGYLALPQFEDVSPTPGGGGPAAPVPGTVVAVEVRAGDEVVEGQTLVVVEAMKMEHRIVADADGVVVDVLVAVGDSVDAHQILVTLGTESDAGSTLGTESDAGSTNSNTGPTKSNTVPGERESVK